MKYIMLEYKEYLELEIKKKCYEENIKLLEGKTIIPNEDYVEYKTLQARVEKAIDKLYCWGEVLDADFQKEMLDILSGDVDNE